MLGALLAALPARRIRSVVVVDQSSTDPSAQVARDFGAIVLHQASKGYGMACQRAVSHLESLPTRPDIVVFVAADGRYRPEDISLLLQPFCSDNAELVLGVPGGSTRRPAFSTRFALGLIRTIYGHAYSDLGTFRAIRFPALVAMGLADSGGGWNVEMQVKAIKLGLHIVEVEIASANIPFQKVKRRKQLAQSGSALFQIVRHATTR